MAPRGKNKIDCNQTEVSDLKSRPYPSITNKKIASLPPGSPSSSSSLESPHVNASLHHTYGRKNPQKRIIFFRIGPLRFGIHGVAGMLSLILTSISLYYSYYEIQAISLPLGSAVVSTSLLASIGSYGLLQQVPTSSKITSWIIPPHKEAFKRTIAIIGYLNIRLIHQWQWFDMIFGIEKVKQSIFVPILLLVYTMYHFFPLGASLSNGNTWVFVLPMFLGFSFDCWQQFPTFPFFSVDKLVDTNSYHMSWERVHAWNDLQVNETYLLLTLWCALQIAFMFTVAFRGLMNIRYCYWIAAVQVGLLCVRLVQSLHV